MSNQMIALQARNPQLPDPARATSQMANMMNMASQQRAAQLQGQRIRQEMDYAQAGETRAAETHTSAQKKAELEYVGLAAEQFRQDVAKLKEGNIAGAEAARANIVKLIPAWDAYISPASEWTPEYKAQLMLKAKEIVDKTYPDVTASKEYAAAGGKDAAGNIVPEGTPIEVRIGGFPGAAGTTPVPMAGAATPPRATPTAPQPSAMERAPSAVSGAEMTFGPDETRPLNATQQEDLRRIQSETGMVDTPASFTRGGMGAPAAAQMTPERAQQIVDTAVKTGMMAQADFDQLMALAPAQNKQPFMDMIQANNITLQPGGMGQQPQFADLRGQRMQSQTAGLRGAPPMEQTMAQYQPLQRRDPNVSPAPGVYSVPTSQIAEKTRAERETPGEVYAKEKARARALREVALEPKPLTAPQEAKLRASITKDYKAARSTLDMMLNPVAGVVAAVDKVRKLSPTQKEAITGYSGYLPTMYAGTKSADTAVKNLKGKVTEMGKSVASLTGAIGQMAVQEWRIVSDMIASLDLEGMNAADLDNQLDIIEAQARRAAEVTRDAYENQYVEEFDRYPGRFRLPDASAMAAPAGKRRTPTGGAVDRNNPLLRK